MSTFIAHQRPQLRNPPPSAPSRDDTLSEFLTAHTDYSNGTGSYVTPAAPNYVRAYRIKYTLIDDDAADNLQATGVDFIWEAQNN